MTFGTITLSSRGANLPQRTVTMLVAPGVFRVADGFAQYTIGDMPRRRGIVEYTGHKPFRIEGSVLFDGYRRGESQEAAISALTAMALPPGARQPVKPVREPGRQQRLASGVLFAAPAPVSVEGAIPQEVAHVDAWVIETLEWQSDGVIYAPTTGERLRQGATLGLREATLEEMLPTVHRAFKRHRVKRAGTVQQIAARVLPKRTTAAERNEWVRIVRERNNLRVGERLKAGRVIKVP